MIDNTKSFRATKWNREHPKRRRDIARESARKLRKSKEGRLRANLNARNHTRRRKILVINHYGGKCECCGETIIEFLSIDHPNNDGYKQRKIIKNGSFYNWLVKNNFPPDYRVQCYNCNIGRSRTENNICPHKKNIKIKGKY